MKPAKKKNIRSRYVDGYVCVCGKLFPATTAFFPFSSGVPVVCPKCGMYEENMVRQAILETRWETGRFFKTEWVSYKARV